MLAMGGGDQTIDRKERCVRGEFALDAVVIVPKESAERIAVGGKHTCTEV